MINAFFLLPASEKTELQEKSYLLEGSMQLIMLISSVWEQDVSLIVCLAVLKVEEVNI